MAGMIERCMDPARAAQVEPRLKEIEKNNWTAERAKLAAEAGRTPLDPRVLMDACFGRDSEGRRRGRRRPHLDFLAAILSAFSRSPGGSTASPAATSVSP
jgi:hypothetical protein